MNDETNPYETFGEPDVTTEPVEPPAMAPPPAVPWGFWATVGFSIVIMIAFLVVQTIVAVPFALAEMRDHPDQSPQALTENLESNGLLMAIATLATGVICSALALLLAGLRRGFSAAEYVGLKWVSLPTVLLWCSLVVLLVFCADGLTYALGREVVPEQMVMAYMTAGFPVLLCLAVVVGAPLFEELFFRGFLFRGLQHSWLGGVGTIIITSLAWAAIHLQYDLFQISIVFVGGLLLGTARLKTGSVSLTIFLHAVWNIIAFSDETCMPAGQTKRCPAG